ncbi:MAG: beta-ketoacyl-ACP synthase III [Paludibacteraceae bacterium]|nr:beta-ketoacyl-ACP synthase III [Paludibacteraceae bacterium]
MESEVFITKMSKFLPNQPIGNDDMELFLGKIGDKPSRVRSIILRQNGIKTRYYALNKEGKVTHTCAEMTKEAILGLFDNPSKGLQDVELLTCGTSGVDQMLPSHTAMVHGLLKNKPMEIISPAGVCASGAHAMKIGYMSIKSGNTKNAICAGGELASGGLLSKNYDKEYEVLAEVDDKPIIAFEKDFLRFMLSDGAGAMLLENKKGEGISLKMEWIETTSYANENPVCMYMGAERTEDGELRSWKTYTEQEWLEKSIFVIKQDVRILEANIIKYCALQMHDSFKKHGVNPGTDVDYFLPHLSSLFFKERLMKGMVEKDIAVPFEKWFINLDRVGNVGSASIYLALEELFNSSRLKKGEKIALMIPESGRFTIATVFLTVV